MSELTSARTHRPSRSFRPWPFAYHQEIELHISTLTNEGRGLGRVSVIQEDGVETQWVVMVSFALPGEKVTARIFRNHKNYSEGDLVSVLESSAARISPSCPVFGQCGGCQYQHLTYEAQLDWKRQQVAELLKHLAGLEAPVEPVVPSPQTFAYRSKITPHFAQPKDGEIREIGFLKEGTRNFLVDVPQCLIATDPINKRLTSLRAEVKSAARSYKKGATLLLREDAEGNVLIDPKAPCLERVAKIEFEHLAGDFWQNNPFILPEFVRYITAQAQASGARYLVDAYCGSGLFALGAAHAFEKVAGVEISATAVERAQANAHRNGITNVSFLAASAEAIFATIPFPAAESAVIIDPPRAGCSEDFLNQLVTWHPSCLVYVSCNPATQMRDLRLLTSSGYHLDTVQPFDLFPQTKHLECVVSLRPNPA